jgi:hypothetical protein
MNRYQVTIVVMADSELTVVSSAANMLITHPIFAKVSQLPKYGYEFSRHGTLVRKLVSTPTKEHGKMWTEKSETNQGNANAQQAD